MNDFRQKICHEFIEQTEWGAAYLREFDLVIAANELASMKSGETLYNEELDAQLAKFCLSLDGDLAERDLGIIKIPPNEEKPYNRVRDAIEFLTREPRGTWARFEMDGKYDAWMSDGYGGTGTRTGHKFTSRSSNAPALTFEAQYGFLIAGMSYRRRNQIRDEIRSYSIEQAGLGVGSMAKEEHYINTKRYSKFELVNHIDENGNPMVAVKATRRGARPDFYRVNDGLLFRVFDVQPVMPPQYDDPDNEKRLLQAPGFALETKPLPEGSIRFRL